VSELEYSSSYATWLTAAGITPSATPINLRGVVHQILQNMVTPTLPAVVNAASLPTTNPHVVGQLWVNSGVVTVSAG
jgi:hypothetical protein